MRRLALILTLLTFPVFAWAAGDQVVQGNCKLAWDEPTTNTDGTKLTDLKEYRLYSATQAGTNWGTVLAATVAGTTAIPVAVLPALNAAPATGGTFLWVCTGLKNGQNYVVVTAVNTAGLQSGPSNELPFDLRAIPGGPSNLRLGP